MLEHKVGAGDWVEAEAEMELRNETQAQQSYFVWQLNSIVPCKENRFRLSIAGKNR